MLRYILNRDITGTFREIGMENRRKDLNETKKIVFRVSEAQLEEKVRKRAYELFMSRKHPANSALDYWLAA